MANRVKRARHCSTICALFLVLILSLSIYTDASNNIQSIVSNNLEESIILLSNNYTISNEEGVISNVSYYNRLFNTFIQGLIFDEDVTFRILKSDGITEVLGGSLESNYKLVVTSSLTGQSKIYNINIDSMPNINNTSELSRDSQTATATSSNSDANSALKAIDNDLSTYWAKDLRTATNQPFTPHSVTVSLGSDYIIDSVKVFNYVSGSVFSKKCNLYISTDGINFDLAKGNISLPNSDSSEGYPIDIEITRATHIRVEVTEAGISRAAIKEISIKGTKVLPNVSEVKILGNAVLGQQLIANYRYYHSSYLEGSSNYKWLRASNANAINQEWEIIEQGITNSSEGASYIIKDIDIGKYIKFEITPNALNTDGEEIIGVSTYSLPLYVVPPTRPEARDLYISGTFNPGEILRANYEYFDANGDIEEGTVIKWYISDDIDGNYTLIQNANGDTYTIKSQDVDKAIKFSVIPKTSIEPSEGLETFSPPVMKPVVPIAKNINVAGKIRIGETITCTFLFFDKNSDLEETNGSKIRLLRSMSQNGPFEEILLGNVKSDEGLSYMITEDDIGKYFQFEITPISQIEPYEGTPIFSNVLAGPAFPTVNNVSIEGEISVGSILIGTYGYYDINGDREYGSDFQWYRVDENGTTSQIVGANASGYKITKNDEGSSLIFEVIPKTDIEPKVGQATRSQGVKVPKAKVTNNSVSVGSQGSGGAVYKPVLPVEKPIGIPAEQDEQKDIFEDIREHWAKDDILSLYDKGVVKGISRDEFSPDKVITRAEFISMVARVLGFQDYAGETLFKDVSKTDWFYYFVNSTAKADIISSDGALFRPNDFIKREEMAKICVNTYKYLKLTEKNIIEGSIKDIDSVSDWAKEYVQKAYAIGIVKGNNLGDFEPKGLTTRAQAAVIINRILNAMEGN